MRELMEKIGFKSHVIDIIEGIDKNTSDKVKEIADEYMQQTDKRNVDPYLQKIDDLKITGVSKYTLYLLFWLHACPILKKEYEKQGIADEIFYNSMKDLSYKVKECEDVYGVSGVFVTWFFLFFDMKLFELGRMQYEIAECEHDYSKNGIEVKKGDRVYSCHIPSSGKFTQELVMDSFDKAYNFFKDELEDDIMPVVCHTWIFYKPYIEKVFKPDSNIKRFCDNFDIIEVEGGETEFEDCWRVFNKMYEDRDTGLPADTSLRRSFIKYMEEGGDFGNGYGILLYNGKTKEIIK